MDEILKLLVLAAVLRARYEVTRPQKTLENLSMPDTTCTRKLTGINSCVNLKTTPKTELPPQVEKWKRKELRGYKEAQEKKWRRWAETMFESES